MNESNSINDPLSQILAVVGETKFNRLIQSIDSTRNAGRLLFWQEQLFDRVAVETGIRVSTFDEFLELFGRVIPTPSALKCSTNVDESSGANSKTMSFLESTANSSTKFADEADPKIAYWESGCHPEIVERVWDKLGTADTRFLPAYIYGRPCLVDNSRRLIVAICFGTEYIIRINDKFACHAVNSGFERIKKWSSGDQTDLTRALGKNWFFGKFETMEVGWMVSGNAT